MAWPPPSPQNQMTSHPAFWSLIQSSTIEANQFLALSCPFSSDTIPGCTRLCCFDSDGMQIFSTPSLTFIIANLTEAPSFLLEIAVKHALSIFRQPLYFSSAREVSTTHHCVCQCWREDCHHSFLIVSFIFPCWCHEINCTIDTRGDFSRQSLFQPIYRTKGKFINTDASLFWIKGSNSWINYPPGDFDSQKAEGIVWFLPSRQQHAKHSKKLDYKL